MWHVSGVGYGKHTAGVSPYLEQVMQESGHAAMKRCFVQFLQQVEQRRDVSQQAPQKVTQTLRIACHVM